MDREDRIDVLRGIGLLCIVLAHVGPPAILFQLRNFDVPLMVLVAGSAFTISTQNRPTFGYIDYIGNRLLRLLVSTWIFLFLFFLFAVMASCVMDKPYPFSTYTIITSFLLLDGIGYVWVIRVFILVSFVAPFTRYCNSVPNNRAKNIYFALLAVYGIYEVVFPHIPKNMDRFILNVMLHIVLNMAIPYGCIFFLGTRLPAMSARKILTVSAISLLLFVAYGFFFYAGNGRFVPTQDYKYPPTAYYVSYALFASTGLYWLSQTRIYSYIPGKKYAAFLGRSSMWIYLWHILILHIIIWAQIGINYILEYIVVLGAAVGIAAAQRALLEKVLLSIDSQETRKLLRAVFSG